MLVIPFEFESNYLTICIIVKNIQLVEFLEFMLKNEIVKHLPTALDQLPYTT